MLQSLGVRIVVLTVCWHDDWMSCQRYTCNGSLANGPVQALWDDHTQTIFVHTVSSPTPPFSHSLSLSYFSSTCSSFLLTHLLSPVLNSDLDGDYVKSLVSLVYFSSTDNELYICQPSHTHIYGISQTVQDPWGAFSDYIPQDVLLCSVYKWSLMCSQVCPQWRRLLLSKESIIVTFWMECLYLSDRYSILSGLLCKMLWILWYNFYWMSFECKNMLFFKFTGKRGVRSNDIKFL